MVAACMVADLALCSLGATSTADTLVISHPAILLANETEARLESIGCPIEVSEIIINDSIQYQFYTLQKKKNNLGTRLKRHSHKNNKNNKNKKSLIIFTRFHVQRYGN